MFNEISRYVTLYAVLDNKTQNILSNIENIILSSGVKSNRISKLPFHITIGTYSSQLKNELLNTMTNNIFKINKFKLNIVGFDTFDDKILYLRPEKNEQLLSLYKQFNSTLCEPTNDWQPHITIYSGTEEDCKKAKEILKQNFSLIQSTISKIEINENIIKIISSKDLK